jgi:hypothetical protein
MRLEIEHEQIKQPGSLSTLSATDGSIPTTSYMKDNILKFAVKA